MHRSGNQDGRVQIGATGWISIHINDPAGSPAHPGRAQGEAKSPPIPFHLFEYAEQAPAPVPERFPRLTFLTIAIALLVTALTAEFDYLRGAGYFWR